jgi:ATPase, YjeE family
VKKGYIICLLGDLGVGKTEFTKGFARGVGVKDYVTSPTFTIVNEYEGRIPVYHFDVYRINDVDEMYEIGYEEYFYGQGVSIIEWADLIKEIIPEENIRVTISKDLEEGMDFRNINIETNGELYKDVFREMIEKCEF